ncbi:MAG: DUF6516 family protein [Caldilineaceae bacterium]
MPLSSLAAYSQFIAEMVNRPTVVQSTIRAWSVSPYTGITEGEVQFANQLWLRMREELDFDDRLITSYGYEVYRRTEKLYWYDDFPHPNDPTLASTHPHHKHIPPDIKHNRIPAPGLSHQYPNLLYLITEIEGLINASNDEVVNEK